MVLPPEKPGPLLLGWLQTKNLALASPDFSFQLGMWVQIVLQHDRYMDYAVLGTPSLAGLQFRIRAIFVESLLKIHEFSPILSDIS